MNVKGAKGQNWKKRRFKYKSPMLQWRDCLAVALEKEIKNTIRDLEPSWDLLSFDKDKNPIYWDWFKKYVGEDFYDNIRNLAKLEDRRIKEKWAEEKNKSKAEHPKHGKGYNWTFADYPYESAEPEFEAELNTYYKMFADDKLGNGNWDLIWDSVI